MNSNPHIPTSPAATFGAESTHPGLIQSSQDPSPPSAAQNQQKLIMLIGSGIMLGTSLWVLNRGRVFSPARFALRTLAPHALGTLSQRLMALSAELGEKVGLLERQPFLRRLFTGRSTNPNVNVLKQAQQKVPTVGGHAVEAIRDGLHETRLYSSRIAKDYPAATAGSGFFILGLLTAALLMPSQLKRTNQNHLR